MLADHRRRHPMTDAEMVELQAIRKREFQQQAMVQRERREEKKARAIRKRVLPKLIGALGMLGSDHAGERAAAALQVERLRAKLGKQWNELIYLIVGFRQPPQRIFP
jgi:hypothetical protein